MAQFGSRLGEGMTRHGIRRRLMVASAISMSILMAIVMTLLVSFALTPVAQVARAGLPASEARRVKAAFQRRMVSSAGYDYAGVAGWVGSMPTEGDARILAIRVSFPKGMAAGGTPVLHGEDDTLEDLQAIIGRRVDGTPAPASDQRFPYESLYAYYLRSSYGQLRISGDAYDYEAKCPRNEYDGDIESLFREALTALDDQIDYADYDGDGDGTIDCVCIRFAGDDGGWGSYWWSYVFHAGTDGDDHGAPLDGKTIDALVMLHRPSGTDGGVRTLIHEVGHVLGLPDYYHKADMGDDMDEGMDDEGGETTPGGIGITDMMNNNSGDHNAFSKWVLGWIGDDRIVKVTCDADGQAVATLGGKAIGICEGGRVTFDVGSFAGDGPYGLGYAVAIYPRDDDGMMGPLSDFYMLQYDAELGNRNSNGYSSVESKFGEYGSSGCFKMLRVMASLDGGTGTMSHDSTHDPKHDQLIEVVNPMENISAFEDGATGADALTAGTLLGIVGIAGVPQGQVEDMMPDVNWRALVGTPVLRIGDEVTPLTTPSTDFGTGGGRRRTDICVRVAGTDEDKGTLEIWYGD